MILYTPLLLSFRKRLKLMPRFHIVDILYTTVVVFQNKMLADVKVLLREAAEREQRLVHDKEELEEKVTHLKHWK